MNPKKTPIYDEHVKCKGKIVDFAGWYLPVEYTKLIEEHNAVRNSVGVFDVSHMGEILVSGKEAADLVQSLITNDIKKLYKGKAIYSPMCYKNAGVVDDLLVYMLDDNLYLLVVNASNCDKDFEWIKSVNTFDAKVENVSDKYFQIALQGPLAVAVMEKLFNVKVSDIKSFHFEEKILAGCKTIVSRTGYTGEDGFEIYGDAKDGALIWQKIIDHGVKPCGLGCRDTLRLEASLPLYGNDIDKDTTPLEAGLGYFVKLDKKEFNGMNVLLKQKEFGLSKKLVGFTIEGKGIPRHGYSILDKNQQKVGEVTSGTLSPTLGYSVGMAYIKHNHLDTENFVEIRKNILPIKIIKMPFYKRSTCC